MDDKTFNDTITRVNTIIHDLKAAVDLRIELRIEYARDAPVPDDEGLVTIMEMRPSWEYARATMVVFVAPCVDMPSEAIALKVLHEFAHYFVHPMSEWDKCPEYNRLEERTCTDLALAFKSAIDVTADEITDHWEKKVKALEKQIKKLEKEKVA